MKTDNRDINAWLDQQLSRQPLQTRDNFNAEVLARLAQNDAFLDKEMDVMFASQPIETSLHFERNVFKRLRRSSSVNLNKVLFRVAIPVGAAAAIALGIFISGGKNDVKRSGPLSDFTDEQIALLSEIDFSEIAAGSTTTPLSEKDLEMLMLL